MSNFIEDDLESENDIPLKGDKNPKPLDPPPGASPYDPFKGKEKNKEEKKMVTSSTDDSIEATPKAPKISTPSKFKMSFNLWGAFILFSLSIMGFITGLFLQNNSNPQAAPGFTAQTLFLPNVDSIPLRGLITLIQQAQTEIIVSAKLINSIQVLDLLVESHKRGVTVLIILDRDTNNVARSPLNLLLSRGFPRDNIFLHPALNSQFIVFDSVAVLTGNMPFNNAGQQQAGEALFIEDRSLANSFRLHAQELARQSN